jgi:hypothetical protein
MNTILSPTAFPKKSLRDIAFDLPGRFPIARWAPIPLRLIVGFGFMEHGFAKLSKGPDAFATILHALAVPAPHFTAWFTILTELLGGLAIFLGAFVSLVSLPMAGLLLVAILLCICHTGLVRLSSSPSLLPARSLDRRAMNVISCTWPAWRRSSWVARDH